MKHHRSSRQYHHRAKQSGRPVETPRIRDAYSKARKLRLWQLREQDADLQLTTTT